MALETVGGAGLGCKGGSRAAHAGPGLHISPRLDSARGVRALREGRSAGQQKRVCQGIAYRRESTHLDAYEFERCACHHSLQGIDSFGDG